MQLGLLLNDIISAHDIFPDTFPKCEGGFAGQPLRLLVLQRHSQTIRPQGLNPQASFNLEAAQGSLPACRPFLVSTYSYIHMAEKLVN